MQTAFYGKTIGFDLDGVIIDHTANKIRLGARYGVHLEPNDTHAERMGAFFPPEVYKEIKAQLYNETEEGIGATLMDGAFEGIMTLREEGIPYMLISLQQNPVFAEHLIKLHGLWGTCFTSENMFFAHDGDEKYALARSKGVTHFIDDEPNILDIMPMIPHRIVFDPRDQFADRSDLIRVKNWHELVEALLAR